MIEALVVAVCVQGPGCSEASSAYYQYNVDLQIAVKKVERAVNKNVPEPVLTYLVPAAGVAAGYKGAIKLYGNISLNLSKSTSELFYSRGF